MEYESWRGRETDGSGIWKSKAVAVAAELRRDVIRLKSVLGPKVKALLGRGPHRRDLLSNICNLIQDAL